MDAASPFAQVPITPEPIAQVRRQLAAEALAGVGGHGHTLDRVADCAVRELWSSRVKTFIPVLALRQAREMLRDQDWPVTVEPSAGTQPELAPSAPWPATESGGRDVLPIPSDVLRHDDREALSL
jgi:hypothetical protein